jgi:hypothetical protein
MDVPTLVSEALGNEEVAAHVPLKGEDALFVTSTRTLRYSDEGLLSDESVDEFPHDAERVSVSPGRRKATIELDYGTGGRKSFTIPGSNLETALHPVLAGVLNANGVTGPGETVTRTFRFSELTVVVTSDRLVKHIGSAVWDQEFEEIPYETVTGLSVEEGNVSSQFVLTTTERTQRIKAPNESFRAVRETIEEAILTYHGVDSIAEFEAVTTEEDAETLEGDAEAASADPADTLADDVSFEEGVDPIGGGTGEGGTVDSATETTESGESSAQTLEENGFTAATEKVEPAIDPDELRAELDDLERAIDRQQEVLDEQQAWIENLRGLIPDQ